MSSDDSTYGVVFDGQNRAMYPAAGSGLYDLGTTGTRWGAGYFSGALAVSGAGTFGGALGVTAGGASIKGTPAVPSADTANVGTQVYLLAGSNAGANNTDVLLYYWRSNAALGYLGYESNTSTIGGVAMAVADFKFFNNGIYAGFIDASNNGQLVWGAGGIQTSGGLIVSANGAVITGTTTITGDTNVIAASSSTAVTLKIRPSDDANAGTTLFAIQNAAGSTDRFVINKAGNAQFTLDLQIGSPTGGAKGAGTANFAADIYKNNSAYSNPHGGFEYAYTGRIVQYADRMKAMGLLDYKPLTLEGLERYTREHYHFPYFGDDQENGLFSGGERLLLITEELAVHLFRLNDRVKNLEARAN
jgi:hypothetical protein